MFNASIQCTWKKNSYAIFETLCRFSDVTLKFESLRKHRVSSCLPNITGVLTSARRDFQRIEVEKQPCKIDISISHKHNEIDDYRGCDAMLLEVGSSENNLPSFSAPTPTRFLSVLAMATRVSNDVARVTRKVKRSHYLVN